MEKLIGLLSSLDPNVAVDIVTRIGHGALSGQELASTAISAVTLILGGLLIKNTVKGYRTNFRFSKNPFYFGTRKAVGAGGALSFLTLPLALIETAISPLYALIGLFTPRDEEDKARMKSELVSVKELAKKLEMVERQLSASRRKSARLSDKIVSLEASVEGVNDLSAQLSSLMGARPSYTGMARHRR